MKCFVCQTQITRGRMHKAYQSKDLSCELHQNWTVKTKPKAKTLKLGPRLNDRFLGGARVAVSGLKLH